MSIMTFRNSKPAFKVILMALMQLIFGSIWQFCYLSFRKQHSLESRSINMTTEMVILVVFASLSSLCIIAGLSLLILNIAYYKQKPTNQSSVFDLIIIDSYIASGILSISFYLSIILLFFAPISYIIAAIISTLIYIFANICFFSCTLTVAMKLIFIKKPNLIFDHSEDKIRMITFVLKIVCFLIILVIDQVSTFNINPFVFDVLYSGSERYKSIYNFLTFFFQFLNTSDVLFRLVLDQL